MNEHIDIAFAGAKVAAKDDPRASVAVHGVSLGYNIAQIGLYRYACGAAMANQRMGMQVNPEQIQQYRRESIKHTVLAGLDILSLFFMGSSGIDRG